MTVANHTCSLIHSFTITFVTPFFCTPCPHRVPEPLGVRRDFLTCQALTSNILFVEVCFGGIGIFQNYGKLASQFAQQTPRSMAKQNFWQARTLPGFQTSLLKCNRRNPKGPRSEVAKFCRDGEACLSPERACAFGCSQWSQAFAVDAVLISKVPEK